MNKTYADLFMAIVQMINRGLLRQNKETALFDGVEKECVELIAPKGAGDAGYDAFYKALSESIELVEGLRGIDKDLKAKICNHWADAILEELGKYEIQPVGDAE